MTVKLADGGCKKLTKMAPCYSPGASRAQCKDKSWWEERFSQTRDTLEGPTNVGFPKQVVKDTQELPWQSQM